MSLCKEFYNTKKFTSNLSRDLINKAREKDATQLVRSNNYHQTLVNKPDFNEIRKTTCEYNKYFTKSIGQEKEFVANNRISKKVRIRNTVRDKETSAGAPTISRVLQDPSEKGSLTGSMPGSQLEHPGLEMRTCS